MNEVLKVLHSRRSIRKYSGEQIPSSALDEILNAAIYAPNATNQQKWHFTVIQDQALIDQMVCLIRDNILKSGVDFLVERASAPDYHTFHHAPIVVLITADEKVGFALLDCGAAAENMALAAESLNIGSCIIGSSRFLFDSEQGKEFAKKLDIPSGYGHVCCVALGYKGEQPVPPPRNRDVFSYILDGSRS